MNISKSASSKILDLTSDEKPFRIQITGMLLHGVHGVHVDLIPNAEHQPNDVTIWTEPLVIADFASVNFLTNRELHFDQLQNEFIIVERAH